MIEYSGMRRNDDFGTIDVFVNGKLLLPNDSLKVWNHSPDGFNWGYGGSGPAQLALAILLDYKGEECAVQYHQDFKRAFVSKWDESWVITSAEIDAWLETQPEQVRESCEGVDHIR